MKKLAESRQEQYKRKVEETFSENLALLDYTRMLNALEAELASRGIAPEEAKNILKRAESKLDDSSLLKFTKNLSLRYGENPGQPAAFYKEERALGPNMATMSVLQHGTKGLGYINLADMDLGQRLVKKLTDVFKGKLVCALIKHEMPSGVAIGEDTVTAFKKAWNCDSLSNFGSVDVFNYAINGELAGILTESKRNVEVVYAPGFTQEAVEILSLRKTLRVVKMEEVKGPVFYSNLECKKVAGGLLVQERYDSKVTAHDCVEVVSDRQPAKDELDAAIFNWIVAGFTRSNAVVIGQKDKTHGIGSGQRSRIDSAENAVRISKRGYGPEGCVLASDAYMPFPDVVELASENGITAIIYPLGSNKDEEVLARANEKGLAMIVTRKPGQPDSERCFLHR